MYLKTALIWLFLSVLLIGCERDDKVIFSERYPNLKWGFTTQNFIESVPVTVENAKAFITYARKEGYSWIELRDPDASFTLDQCEKIADFARANNIEINYSVQRGLLDEDFWEIFNKAVVNTSVFDGPGYFRALAFIGEGDLGWTEEEFKEMVETANKAAAMAKEQGVKFTVENADSDIDGRGKPYYGLWEFFAQTNADVTLQFDTANFFTVPTEITAKEVEKFIRTYAFRISYLHLKSARDGQALPVLDDNALDFGAIFNIMHDFGVYYTAIELASVPDKHQVHENMDKSIEYLSEAGFIMLK